MGKLTESSMGADLYFLGVCRDAPAKGAPDAALMIFTYHHSGKPASLQEAGAP